MRISDWSSYLCSSDLRDQARPRIALTIAFDKGPKPGLARRGDIGRAGDFSAAQCKQTPGLVTRCRDGAAIDDHHSYGTSDIVFFDMGMDGMLFIVSCGARGVGRGYPCPRGSQDTAGIKTTSRGTATAVDLKYRIRSEDRRVDHECVSTGRL